MTPRKKRVPKEERQNRAAAPASRPYVVVAGDVTVDWHIALSPVIEGGTHQGRYWRPWREWNPEESTFISWERGGAARLGDLIEKLAGESYRVCKMAEPPEDKDAPVSPADVCHHSYALWSQFKLKKEPPKDKVWRVSQFLGLHRHAEACRALAQNPAEAFLVLLDDANLGFRDLPHQDFWPRAIKPEAAKTSKSPQKPEWVILKMANPVVEGALWEHLYKNYLDRLIVVIPINDLRRSDVQISRELSWERTAQDLAQELIYNPRINSLSRCAFVVISLESAGALLYCRDYGENTPRFSLIFDPLMLEGAWGRDHQGSVIGYNTCLAAGLADQILRHARASFEQLYNGILAGNAGMRRLHNEGYAGAPFSQDASPEPLYFPEETIINELCKDETLVQNESRLALVNVPAPGPPKIHSPMGPATPDSDFWTILGDRYTANLGQVAQKTALHGPELTLSDVPQGKFKKLTTVDRQEIESYRSIRNLIREYYCHSRQNKPLSIAVFGPPGSGKSFGIVQVAESLLKDKIQVKEFNLSQFNDPQELLGALHQVRDLALKEKLPLVFWDEFDAALQGKPLGWLRYFLAPMQDGTFQEDQITHPIGRAIFVFAGGTRTTMESFSRLPEDRELSELLSSDETSAGNEDRRKALRKLLEEFRGAKGPDFVSRIKAHIDILGPNRWKPPAGQKPRPDPFYIIRRALVLRTLLDRHWPQLFQGEGKDKLLRIDPGVLKAFLEIGEYRHGVRSMENIIATCMLHGKDHFDRSSLPPAEQLNLHVDGPEFLQLVSQIVLKEAAIEKLADEVQKTYAWLTGQTEEDKESNRGFARDIPNKLARIGCTMVEAWAQVPPVTLTDSQIEIMAEMEHDRWLKEKIDLGWRYGPARDNDQKLHPALLPWRRLSKEEKESLHPYIRQAMGEDALPWYEKRKDRCLVSKIPEMLANTGYTVVKEEAVGLTEKESENWKSHCMVVVGVTGHRILMEIPKIKAGIDKAVRHIEHIYPGRTLTLLSPLAEGADRLVADKILRRARSRLIAPLPLERSDYLKDFTSRNSPKEFLKFLEKAQEVVQLPPASSRDEAYEAVGRYVLDHCDVLIAVWDGQGAQGVGGTGGIVAEARRKNKPIAWVHAGNRQPETEEPTTLKEEQGKVTFENF